LLDSYGWSATLQRQFQPHAARGLIPARVTVQHRGLYRLACDHGDLSAELSGRFLHDAEGGDHPVAGDWVAAALRPEAGAAIIRHVLPRFSAFVRRAAGPRHGAQVVAANVDLALLTASLNGDLNLRRLERYLVTARESRAEPVIVLTKADMCEDVETRVAQVRDVALGIPVHAVSALTGQGLEALTRLLGPGRTAVLLGSSGVGKSTLVNALAGQEVMATQAIREDDAHGRHTTTHRELVLLPGGGLVLDTPGMRELGLWDSEAGVAATFADVQSQVDALAARCRFGDCAHAGEPGCAVAAALADGTLDEGRWRSYGKLQRELNHLALREDPIARNKVRKTWIAVNKAQRAAYRRRWSDD
jgi:ribosome biogenesis GTPase